MSQHDMNIANGPGASFRADLNGALAALASLSSGAAAPNPTFPFQFWADTGTGRLKLRNSANTAWVDNGPIDGAWAPLNSPTFTGSVLVPAATLSGQAMQLGQAVGRLLGVQVFSTAGTFTYTPTPGTNKVIPQVQAAGGAGGGAPATGAGVSSMGAPGGAGAYAESLITSAFSGVTITVGAGGTGVSGANGNNGGPSSFGALISCPGGRGGPIAGPAGGTFYANSLNSTAPSGGNIRSNIGAGSDTAISPGVVGRPGASLFGAGSLPAGGGVSGVASTSPGAGGSGTGTGASSAALTGGAGAPGIVIVWEYA